MDGTPFVACVLTYEPGNGPLVEVEVPYLLTMTSFGC